MESLFSYIKSYIPTSQRDPQEDYLTQLLAWMLINVDGLAAKYCRFLLSSLQGAEFAVALDDTVSVQTQVVVEQGRVDMLLSLGQNGLICEHKVASNLGDRQIERYVTSYSGKGGCHYSVLITANTLQHTQEADISLTWADVYDFLQTERENYENEHGFLINQLIQYLTQQGLGRMEPVTMENILGYFPGLELPAKLESLLVKLQSMDWLGDCPNLGALSPGSYEPTFKKLRWGRVGVEFFRDMVPGLFGGVLLDNRDHNLEYVDASKGPDLIVALDYDYYPNPKDDYQRKVWQHRDAILAHPSFRAACTQISLNGGDFQPTIEPSKNRWRVIVLQKPLASVLYGAHSEREQMQRIFEAICDGINLIVSDELLQAISASNSQG